MSNTQNLEQFRQQVYQNFNKRADTLMDLLDALCSSTQASSVVELILESCFRRSYSTIFKALDEYQPSAGDLAKLAGPHLAWPEQRPFWLLGVDVTSQPRQYAHTLEGRGFLYQPNLIWGNKPITIGHQYSTVALLPKEDSQSPVPWSSAGLPAGQTGGRTKRRSGRNRSGPCWKMKTCPFTAS